MERVGCHGEARHAEPDAAGASSLAPAVFRFRYARRPLKIVVRGGGSGGRGIADGGHAGAFVLEGEHLCPNAFDQATTANTVCLFMHPAAVMNMLPFPAALARGGCHVVTCHSRYANFDFNLRLELCLEDLHAVVRHCKDALGFARVVLIGWSGGGALMTYYQSEAERPDPALGLGLRLEPADALVCVAAHAGRARILTECLDPSVWLHRRDPAVVTREHLNIQEFDLYGFPAYREDPSLLARRLACPQFLARFREAQVARNRRITAWAYAHPGASFVLDGTMMDPRWISPDIDPNDRSAPFSCYLGDPRIANDINTGLARFSSSESWLSQWSLEESNGDAVEHMRSVKRVPVLVVENGADNGCPRSHCQEYFASCSAPDKTFVCIKDATHYYSGQKDKLAEAASVVLGWLADRGFVRIDGRSVVPQQHRQNKTDGAANDALARLRSKYDGSDAMQISGVNHLALVSSDMQRTCEFYGGVLGLRLTKTIALPGGGQHFFFALDGASTDAAGEPQSMAFFWFGAAAPAAVPGVSSPSLQQLLETGQHPSASGSMNHVAFNVPEDKLRAYRKRILRSGLCPFASPIVYHADTDMGVALERSDPRVTWASVYFFGPDGELLEITSQIGRYAADRDQHVSVLPRPALWRGVTSCDCRGKL